MESSSQKSWRLNDAPSDLVEPIAIIGTAARFAKDAFSVEDLRDILLEARSTWSPIPKERFNSEAFYHPDPEHGGTV
jgi:acyl transferase domain-containing protein